MKPTHVIIPLDVYEQLEKQYDDMPKSRSEAVMMHKAIITGKMQMLYDPSFIRLSLDEKSIELLKNESSKFSLHLKLTDQGPIEEPVKLSPAEDVFAQEVLKSLMDNVNERGLWHTQVWASTAVRAMQKYHSELLKGKKI